MKTILLLLLINTSIYANFWTNEDLDRIAKESTWLKLLHYKAENEKSAIIDKTFFLNDEGATDPKKELLSTLEAYTQTTTDNTSPQCRFPARYFWLSTQLNLPNYKGIDSACTKLLKWKLLKSTDSISVIFVSGYLGNPASAFGHSFIKINQSNNVDDNLFDTSISYGALLPEKYSMPEYIFNGITGGYEAAYSDKYYYNQDVTYSNEEFRDMWEYRLNLTTNQKRLFLLHAWELVTKRNQYFFLNRNCGYKVSEFIELLYDESFTKGAYIWYAPIETFYKLKEIEEKHSKKIIDKIIYIPSKQSRVYSKFKKLSEVENQVVTQMIEEKLNAIPLNYKDLSAIEKSNILDFILAYRKYKLKKEHRKEDAKEKAFTKSLLLSRLKLPMKKSVKRERKRDVNMNKEAITNSNSPTYVGVGVVKNQNEKNLKATIFFSPFAIEKEGYNHLEGDELVVFDTKVTLDKKRLSLEKLDLIRIQKLKTKQIPFDEENPFSWNLQIATTNYNKRDYFVDAGVGLAWDVNENIKFYSMVNLSAHSDFRHYRYMPNIGLFGNFNNFRVTLNSGYENDIDNREAEYIFSLNSQYHLNDNLSMFLEYSNRDVEHSTVGLKWFY